MSIVHNRVRSSSRKKVGVAVMTQFIPHVDWSLALVAILFVTAIGHFVQNQVKLYKQHDLYGGLRSLGMMFVMGVAAIQIATPSALTGSGTTISAIAKLCLAAGVVLLAASSIGSLRGMLDRVPRFGRGKHASGATASPAGTV